MIKDRRGVSKTQLVAAVVLVALIASGGTYLVLVSRLSSAPSATSTTSTASAPSSTLTVDDVMTATGEGGDIMANDVGQYVMPWWDEGTVYQTLVALNLTAQQNHGQTQFLPDLATSWTISPDQKTYTFDLRKNVTYSNGDVFNAYTVWTQFYLTYYLEANSTGFWSFGLNLFNLGSVNFGPATLSLINQTGLASPSQQLLSIMESTDWPAYVTGPYTIVFQLSTPFPFFMSTFLGVWALCFDVMSVIHHGGISPGSVDSWFGFNPPAGTGPYTFSEIQLNAFIKFVKNPTYWGEDLSADEIAANPMLDPGHYDTVVLKGVPDDVARYVDLTTGKVQMAGLRSTNFQLLSSNPDYGVATLKYPAMLSFLVMNNKIFPTNITLVRQAIVHAINYSAIIDGPAFGYGIRMMGPETPNYGPYYDPGNFPPYEYNVALAENDLAKAGFPNGTGMPTIALEVDQGGAIWQVPAAEIIQQNLAQIGITVNIEVVTDSLFYAPLGNYQTDVKNAAQMSALRFDDPASYAPDYYSPTDYWVGFVTSMSGWGNYGVYSNPIVDHAVQQMVSSTNETQGVQFLTTAQKQIYDDAPYAWLFAAKLPLVDGSYVYPNSVLSSTMYFEPNLWGMETLPLFNTIRPAS